MERGPFEAGSTLAFGQAGPAVSRLAALVVFMEAALAEEWAGRTDRVADYPPTCLAP